MSKALYVGALLLVVAGLGVQAQSPATGQPQNWPDRPIRWIVPYPAGGGTDVVARAVADQLSQSLHQPVIVDNRAGGNTIIGTTTVAQAAPDGYTIGLITDAFSANVALGRQMPYDSDRDFVPIVQLTRVPFVLIVNPKLVPMRTLPELISYAKGHPGWLTAATLGPGSPHETAMSWFKSMTGIDMLIVPYRGGNLAMTDLIGGQVKAMMSGAPAAEEIIKSGKAFPIAMASAARLQEHAGCSDLRRTGLSGIHLCILVRRRGAGQAAGRIAAAAEHRDQSRARNKKRARSHRDRRRRGDRRPTGAFEGNHSRVDRSVPEDSCTHRQQAELTGIGMSVPARICRLPLPTCRI